MSDPAPDRRRYDSTLRRQRAAETRARIVEAGCDLLAGTSIRDWRSLTIRAVAERAGVNERTVYRHFENERALRDAVMRRIEEQAGIELDDLDLAQVADVAARIFETIAAHPVEPRPPLDPTLNEAARRQREALLAAVGAHTEGWREEDRVAVAAVFDLLWGFAAYERLVSDWHLDRDRATAAIRWAIGLLEEAVTSGRRPGDPAKGTG